MQKYFPKFMTERSAINAALRVSRDVDVKFARIWRLYLSRKYRQLLGGDRMLTALTGHSTPITFAAARPVEPAIRCTRKIMG
ncbi:hypothetical protein [uncultured Ruegeria sp.]|uniref:hypothetical protein n=1 Tax=uncultured Ruegeria sp. TaxID=259304 RepID=UPI00260F33CC|nr:hypothetical protein [uncultured Ruegeria sp.]